MNMKHPLDKYDVAPSIKILYESGFKCTDSYGPEEHKLLAEVISAKQGSPLTEHNYRRRLWLLNQIEDEHLRRANRHCPIYSPLITERPDLIDPEIGGNMYQLPVTQLKNSSKIKEDSSVRFTIEGNKKTVVFSGIVHAKDHKYLTIFTEKSIPCSSVMKIDFVVERTSFQMEYRALDLLNDALIEKIFFPELATKERSIYSAIEGFEDSEFDWLSPSVATNPEQAQAVRNIFYQSSFPAPYVLLGPPGTGKTSTLVEAIGQIYELNPYANVLAVATSNSAADELTGRLLEIIPEKEIFRYFAKSMARKRSDIGRDVLDVSNLRSWRYGMESKEFYEKIRPCRIVTCTLTTAGRLLSAKIPRGHFGYIFIDECGSAKEISCLIPILGIATDGEQVTAGIVLAGDPKQLGPVIQYEFLKETSHGVSLLERITEHGMYKERNPKFITQLRDNFRSHEAILDLPNRMFYDGALRAKAPGEKVSWAVGWHQLPNPNFPMIFHSLEGETLQDEGDSSMYNIEEAEMIFSYVKDMLTYGINGKSIQQQSIGVISPYARQVKYLKELFKGHRWNEIEVGSTEQYQGREKAIMLMTTVRSGGTSVGFLADAKRLNVSITRAQALMIVVGNSKTLKRNRLWKKFIDYCERNHAMTFGVLSEVSEVQTTQRKRIERHEKAGLVTRATVNTGRKSTNTVTTCAQPMDSPSAPTIYVLQSNILHTSLEDRTERTSDSLDIPREPIMWPFYIGIFLVVVVVLWPQLLLCIAGLLFVMYKLR